MTRGELYRVRRKPGTDPRRFRVFLIASRQTLIDSRFSTLICAPVYSRRLGLSTQVDVGPSEGLKVESAIYCDELISLPKSALTNYVGRLGPVKMSELDQALKFAFSLE